MPYGFYAVTTNDGDEVNAMVANWVTQSSFSPRQLTLAIQHYCYSYGLMHKGRVFAVNIFHQDNFEAMRPFTKARSKSPDKMETATFTPAPETGCPVLEGAAAFIECKIVAILDTGGDHHLIVGEVINAGVNQELEASEALTLPHIGWSYAG
jgi:flavin reductase (DIM6/NTAB) family NADH-FMN oxidoreductase RutF